MSKHKKEPRPPRPEPAIVPPYASPSSRRLTVLDIARMKGKEGIAALTAYDFPTASMVDQAGVDVVLVGDSLGNVVLGQPDTLGVTMADMVRHTQAVARGLQRALLVADMPFLSYQLGWRQAMKNAGRLLVKGGAQAVKLEGGVEQAATIRRLVAAGIPVMAHVGLTPQSVHQLGGYYMHGKTDEDRNRILDDALAVQDAGAFSIVLECVQTDFATQLTKALRIPTIGIGAGDSCDGQILVFHDLVGFTVRPVPRFVQQRADVRSVVVDAVGAYRATVKNVLNIPVDGKGKP